MILGCKITLLLVLLIQMCHMVHGASPYNKTQTHHSNEEVIVEEITIIEFSFNNTQELERQVNKTQNERKVVSRIDVASAKEELERQAGKSQNQHKVVTKIDVPSTTEEPERQTAKSQNEHKIVIKIEVPNTEKDPESQAAKSQNEQKVVTKIDVPSTTEEPERHVAKSKNERKVVTEIDEPIVKEDFYYWRDYDGTIPPDAFVTNAHKPRETPIYVGLSHFVGKGVFLSVIKPPQQAYFAFGNNIVRTKHTKILCSTNNSRFKWIFGDKNIIKRYLHCDLVKAGEDVRNAYALVGRSNIQNKINIGRIVDAATNARLTTFTQAPNKEISVRLFEVLAYNC